MRHSSSKPDTEIEIDLTAQIDGAEIEARGTYRHLGFQGDFGNWKQVCSDFRMEEPEPEEVILARYETPAYEGYASVVYRDGDTYYLAEGSHCSCHGLEEQWKPEPYSLATLVLAMAKKVKGWHRNDVENDEARELYHFLLMRWTAGLIKESRVGLGEGEDLEMTAFRDERERERREEEAKAKGPGLPSLDDTLKYLGGRR